MKQLIKVLGFCVGLASALNLSASQSILYWNDYNVGTDQMAAALADLSGTYSITYASGDADFTAQLAGGAFDLAILAIQNSYGYSSVGAIGSFVTAGGKAIYQSWYIYDGSQLAPFGVGYTSNTNNNSVTVTDASLAAGLSSNPFTLTNPGWGIYSTGLSGGSSAGKFSTGESAIVIGNGGNTIVNGFLTDTAGANGKQLYKNEIGSLLTSTVPDSGSSLLLLGLGLSGLAMFRSRRRA